tara:strand:+ start:703 stop:1644 length:942 start_codon:yes stop_codon:yes gene_type:complete
MSSLRKIDRDRAFADLANVESILEGLDDRDRLTRLSLQSRRDEIRESVNALDAAPPEGLASIALFFGGDPVVASTGIESEFASASIGRFQDLVAKYLANTEGELGQRGVVPNKAAATLHVTSIVRGSFGFLLEEIGPQRNLVQTSLKSALDGVSDLLKALSGPDDHEFEQQLEAVDNRVLESARGFFDVIAKHGATLKTVSDHNELSFSTAAIARAVERANSVHINEETRTVSGILVGALPLAHRFEMALEDDGDQIISGSIDRSFSRDQITDVIRDLLETQVAAVMVVKSVFRNGALAKTIYRLLRISADGV